MTKNFLLVCPEIKSEPEASKTAVLEKIEESYPNPVSLETLCSSFTGSSEAQMRVLISELQLDKKIKALEHNLNSFTRVAGLGENISSMVLKIFHQSKNIRRGRDGDRGEADPAGGRAQQAADHRDHHEHVPREDGGGRHDDQQADLRQIRHSR